MSPALADDRSITKLDFPFTASYHRWNRDQCPAPMIFAPCVYTNDGLLQAESMGQGQQVDGDQSAGTLLQMNPDRRSSARPYAVQYHRSGLVRSASRLLSLLLR